MKALFALGLYLVISQAIFATEAEAPKEEKEPTAVEKHIAKFEGKKEKEKIRLTCPTPKQLVSADAIGKPTATLGGGLRVAVSLTIDKIRWVGMLPPNFKEIDWDHYDVFRKCRYSSSSITVRSLSGIYSLGPKGYRCDGVNYSQEDKDGASLDNPRSHALDCDKDD